MNPMASPAENNKRQLGDFNGTSDFTYTGLTDVGPYLYDDGSTYKGQFSNGNRNGLGTEITRDGSVYEGYWQNDSKTGNGRLLS